jgi:hypothetical protein
MTNLSDGIALADPEDLRHQAAVIRELDRRRNDGISVTLLWNADTNRVFVSVVEERAAVSFEFEVAGAHAADAFHHPYAYASHAPDTMHPGMRRNRNPTAGRGPDALRDRSPGI